jgi:transposase-like protein
MKIILPPKRWEEDSPDFDLLRHKLWYRRGLKRKHLIPALKEAANLYHEGGRLVKSVCAEFGVDEREFRDWYGFHIQSTAFEPLGPKEQRVLDAAYAIYCDSSANYSFRHCIERAAEYYGMKKRPLVEAWEVNPIVYPTGYKQPTLYAQTNQNRP